MTEESKKEWIIMNKWEGAYLGKGTDIWNLIGPFYSPTISFELRKPAPDLATKIQAATSWRQTSGLRIIQFQEDSTQFFLRRLNIDVGNGIGESLWRNYRLYLHKKLGGDSGFLKLRQVFRESLLYDLGSDTGALVWCIMWHHLSKTLDDNTINALGVNLRTGLGESLFYGVGLTITGSADAKSFHELLSIWRSGNIPLGFDRRDKVVVLTA